MIGWRGPERRIARRVTDRAVVVVLLCGVCKSERLPRAPHERDYVLMFVVWKFDVEL